MNIPLPRVLRGAALALVLLSPAWAQLAPLGNAADDGIFIEPPCLHEGPQHWNHPARLERYRPARVGPFRAPDSGRDTVAGLSWSATAPLLPASVGESGLLRFIFLGDDLPASLTLGYDDAGRAGEGRSLWTAGNEPLGFGDHATFSLTAEDAERFDLWVASGDRRTTLFRPDSPDLRVRWSSALWLSTAVGFDASGAVLYRELPVHLVSVDTPEWDRSAIFGVQVVSTTGAPLAPVPEPAAYGATAGVILMIAVALGRHRRRRATLRRGLPGGASDESRHRSAHSARRHAPPPQPGSDDTSRQSSFGLAPRPPR